MPITTPEQLALAKRVRNQIASRPEQHNQDIFFLEDAHSEPRCRTEGCIAGWTAILSGACFTHSTWVRAADGYFPVETYAAARLGLDKREADRLFGTSLVDELGEGAEGKARRYLEELIAQGETALSGAIR